MLHAVIDDSMLTFRRIRDATIVLLLCACSGIAAPAEQGDDQGSQSQSSSVPAPDADDTVVYEDDFEAWASTSELKDFYTTDESLGTVNLDTEEAHGGSQSFRTDWEDRSDGNCSDARVLIERAINKMNDDRVEPDQHVYVDYWLKVSPGYAWDYEHAGIDNHDCNSSDKMFIIYRLDKNDYRFTQETTAYGHCDPYPPTIWGEENVPNCQASDEDKVYYIMSMTGSVPTGPNSGMANTYQVHDSENTTPIAMEDLDDGQWHHVVTHVRNESTDGAGDGRIEMWIDGTKVMDYRGDVAGHPAEGQVFTGVSSYDVFQYPSTKNDGAPQAQSKWYDDVRIWSSSLNQR